MEENARRKGIREKGNKDQMKVGGNGNGKKRTEGKKEEKRIKKQTLFYVLYRVKS